MTKATSTRARHGLRAIHGINPPGHAPGFSFLDRAIRPHFAPGVVGEPSARHAEKNVRKRYASGDVI